MLTIFRRLSGKMGSKINYPSADRNKTFILEVMQKYINPAESVKLLEVSSGTGQQAAFFATKFPKMTIQTSEVDLELFESIKAYASEVPNKNVKDPVKIDASQGPWSLVDAPYDYILNVNMFHVSPWNCSVGFFKYGSQVLKPGGLIFTYGALMIDGVITPQSNVDFDRSIRQRDPNCGLRDLRDLEKVAKENGIVLKQLYDLPANNKCCVWEKTA
ncbi:UPF0585 protein CG18661 [Anthonomus grandis grandis]|uniref:UPF0585 protein CG18661 n=1 Tax=Anthonomus grandis grandis TaxID=2921223 RepID=UPI0021655216|nr:UPF0585 protein CG18661 [Anthonomus grandis grandis]